jgi:pilus assembly protein CpaB
MKAKRLLLALLLALSVSGLFTLWISRRLAKATHAPVAPERKYVAASKPLEAGQALTKGSLELITWPTPLSGGFTRIEDAEARIVLFPLPQGEPILERQLATVGSGAGLAAKIPAGMRAISVRSDEIVGVAGFLLPGTHVDVLMTYRSVNSPELQTVTVLLKPEDAEKLVLATSLGGIHFVLRNGADGQQTPSQAVGLPQLAGLSVPAPVVAAGTPVVKPEHPKPKPYEVETILGDKKVFNGFY